MNSVKEPTMAELYSNPELTVKRKRRWGWIFISFFFFGIISNMSKEAANGNQSITLILYFLSAITAPMVYYWLKPKVKIIKNNFLKSFIIGITVIVIFALLSAILGAISYAMIYQYAE
jgi:hypothetical protein